MSPSQMSSFAADEEASAPVPEQPIKPVKMPQEQVIQAADSIAQQPQQQPPEGASNDLHQAPQDTKPEQVTPQQQSLNTNLTRNEEVIYNPQPTKDGPYDSIIFSAAKSYGLDPFLLKALIHQESNFNSNATGPATKYGQAKGLTQLIDSTAKSLGVNDPYDPMQSIYGGAAYLKKMMDRYGGNVVSALAAYNAGPGNVDKYGGMPPFKETNGYVSKIQKYYGEYSGNTLGDSAVLPEVLGNHAEDKQSNLADIILHPFISTAQASESTEGKRAELKAKIDIANKFVQGRGGWDKLNPQQQEAIQATANEYEKLQPKAQTAEAVKDTLNKAVEQDKGIHVNYGDQYNNILSNVADLTLGPTSFNSHLLESMGINVSPDVASKLDLAQGFKRSFLEKFVDSASLGFIQGNLEKPIDQQSIPEQLIGKAGSVLGTIVGFSFPFAGAMKASTGLAYSFSKLTQESLAAFGVGAVDAISHGKDPLTQGAEWAAAPVAFKFGGELLSKTTGSIQKLLGSIHDKSIQKFLTARFVPQELDRVVGMARSSKTVEEFKGQLVSTAKELKTLGEFFSKNKKYLTEKPNNISKADIASFWNDVNKNKIASLNQTVREYVGKTLNSKKEIIKANDLQNLFEKGGTVEQGKRSLGKSVKNAGRYVAQKTANVLRKMDPIYGDQMVKMEVKEAGDAKAYLGRAAKYLKDHFKGVSSKAFSTAVDIVEGTLSPEARAKIPNIEEVAGVARDIKNFLQKIGRRLEQSGVQIKGSDGNMRAFRTIENYFPTQYLTPEALDKLGGMDLDNIQNIGEYLVKIGASKDLDSAVRTWDAMIQDQIAKTPKVPKPGYEYARTAATRENYRKDIGVLYDYAMSAARRIAFAENYGPNGENLLQLGQNIVKKGGDPRFVAEYVGRLLGTEKPSVMGDLFHYLRISNTFMFGPGVTALRLGGIGNIPVTTGMESFAKGVANAQKNMDLILKSGALNSHLLDQIGEMQSGMVQTEDWLGKAQRKFMDLLGFQKVENLTRTEAASSGIEFYKKLFDKYRTGDGGSLAGKMLQDYMEKPELAAAVKRGFLNQQDLIKAAQRIEKDTQFWYLTSDLPLFFTSEWGKTITQFKATSYLYTSFLKQQVYNEFKKGNTKPLFLWAVADIPINEVVGDIKNYLQGKDPFNQKSSGRPDEAAPRLVDDLLFQGHGLGILAQAKHSIDAYNKGNSTALIDFLGGPSVTKIDQVIKTAAAYWGKDGFDLLKGGKASAKFGLSLIPGFGTLIKNTVFPPKAPGRKPREHGTRATPSKRQHRERI